MLRNSILLAAAGMVAAHILVRPAFSQEEDYGTLIYPAFKVCQETGDKSPLGQRTQQCTIPIDWARVHKEYSILTEALTDRCWVHVLLNEAEPAKLDCAAAVTAEQAYERKGENAADYAHAVYAANAALKSLLGDFKGALG